jgi:hypothetical protein
VSREEIPYPHPGEAMDTERVYAANDGEKKFSSPFASRYPHPRPTCPCSYLQQVESTEDSSHLPALGRWGYWLCGCGVDTRADG